MPRSFKNKLVILDRYLLWEFLGPFLFFISGLIIVGMVDVIFVYIDWLINQGVGAGVIIKLLIFKIPFITILFFPMAVLFATMLVFVRLAKDTELVVFRTSGIPMLRIIRPVIFLGIFLSFLAFFINEKIVPLSNHASEMLVRRIILKNPLPQIQQNVFFHGGKNRYFYIQSINPKTKELNGVMIYELTWTGYPKLITGKRGFFKDGRWYLKDGIFHDFNAKGELVCQATFDEAEINFNRDFETFFTDVKSTLEMNSAELKKQIEAFRKSGITTRILEVDFFVKQATPFANLIFTLIGMALSINFVRSQRDFWGIIMAVGLAILASGFFFFNLAAFRAFGRGAWVSPLVAAWGPNILFGVASVFLILKESFGR